MRKSEFFIGGTRERSLESRVHFKEQKKAQTNEKHLPGYQSRVKVTSAFITDIPTIEKESGTHQACQ